MPPLATQIWAPLIQLLLLPKQFYKLQTFSLYKCVVLQLQQCLAKLFFKGYFLNGICIAKNVSLVKKLT